MKIVKEVKTQAKHPVQIAVLVWWVLACLEQLIVGPPPSSIPIEHTTQLVMLSLLLVSSLVCLAGSLIQDVILGLALELWGWVGICVLFVIYGYLIVAASPSMQAAASAVIFPAFIIGGAWRVVQIRMAQKRLKHILRDEIDPLP